MLLELLLLVLLPMIQPTAMATIARITSAAIIGPRRLGGSGYQCPPPSGGSRSLDSPKPSAERQVAGVSRVQPCEIFPL